MGVMETQLNTQKGMKKDIITKKPSDTKFVFISVYYRSRRIWKSNN